MFRWSEEDRWCLVQPMQPPPRRAVARRHAPMVGPRGPRRVAPIYKIARRPGGRAQLWRRSMQPRPSCPRTPGGIQSLVADKLWRGQDDGGSRLEMMLQMLEKSGSAAGDVRASEASDRNMWRRTVGCARSRRSKRFARTSRTSELQTDSIVLIQALRAAGKWPR